MMMMNDDVDDYDDDVYSDDDDDDVYSDDDDNDCNYDDYQHSLLSVYCRNQKMVVVLVRKQYRR